MENTGNIQRSYYQRIASKYDQMHVHNNDEHHVALGHIWRFVEKLGISTMLDVGCGTGRGVKYFTTHDPAIKAKGIDPVFDMLLQAVDNNNIPTDCIVCGRGESLPFGDKSFDAVCALGILHHVEDHNAVVREMIRVARKAVFISDGNRFGQGNMLIRLIKLLFYKAHLWGVINFLKTNGRGYVFSEGDGLMYSYSVFDSLGLIKNLADEIVLLPTESTEADKKLPVIISASHILLCVILNKDNASVA